MTEYNYENVKVEFSDDIGWVILNRPEKRNAMSPELHEDMDDALAKVEFDGRAKIVVIMGAGGNFSAGQDLKRFFREMDKEPAARKRSREVANRWRWERLTGYDKPTIAMIEGYCVGGAFMQLMGCDLAIAADDAQFSLSEVNWGILPGALVAKVVADAILPRHAMYHACMGDAFSGSEAERIGLITHCVPKEQLRDTVIELARRLMTKSPNALRATKQAIRNVRGMETSQAYDYLYEKSKAIRVGDSQDSYNTGIRQFLDEKSYKPAHGSFQIKKDV
jgi:trans-feruloyl-CoA hydratase/vanillin synthase